MSAPFAKEVWPIIKAPLDLRTARLRDIRAMAGRASLVEPQIYKVKDLEGPLLDLAVANAQGIKAVIHQVDNAISPFYECCILGERGRLQCQYLPSRSWAQAGPIIDDQGISFQASAGSGSVLAFMTDKKVFAWGDSHCHAAMRCYVKSVCGEEVTL